MKRTLIIVFSLLSLNAFGQDELLEMLEKEQDQKSQPVIATFKGTRNINFSTIEVQGKKTLEFRIAHRFGDAGTDGAAGRLFGLDGPVCLQLSFDYSLTDRLSLGIGRTNTGKLIDGNVKYRILRQTTDNKMPVSVTYKGQLNITHQDELVEGAYDKFINRMSYANHLMIARKFNSSISVQANMMHFHYNLVPTTTDKNDILAAGLLARVKLTQRIAITGEYGMAFGDYSTLQSNYYHPAAIGVDIETGGHVFQLFFCNSFAINEAQFVPFNNRSWSDGQFRWGFNVSRVFSL